MLIASIVVPYSMAWAGVLGGGLFQLGAVALLIWLGVMAVQHKPDGA